jgi:hypothetical protein
MTTKKQATPQPSAADAVKTYHQRALELAEARHRHETYQQSVSRTMAARGPMQFRRSVHPEDLRLAELYREVLEAEEAMDQAGHIAAAKLDAEEIAAGDALALERDPSTVHRELSALADESTALREKLADVDRRWAERVTGAFRADAEHAGRRSAAGLPPSPPLPQRENRFYLTVIAERVAHGVPLPNRAAAIENARADELRFAAILEEKRLAEEEATKQAESDRKYREQEDDRERQRVHAAERARNTEAAAEAQRRENLARDYQARRASAVS